MSLPQPCPSSRIIWVLRYMKAILWLITSGTWLWVCILSIVTAISVADCLCCHSPADTQCVPQLPVTWQTLTAGSVDQCLWLWEHCHRCTCCQTLLTRADSQQPLYVLSPSNGAPAACIFGCPTTMCRAAKNTSGRGSFRGAQHVRGLLRIYPCRQEARNKLLLEGMHLWRVQVSLLPIKLVHLTRPKQWEISYKTVGGNFPHDLEIMSSKQHLKSGVVKCGLRWEKNLPVTKMEKWPTGK